MRGLWKLTLVQVKLYLREPAATFFTIIFAPLLLLLFGTIYGNKPNQFFGGRGMVDVSVPSYIAMIIVSVGFMGIPIATAASREAGVLRRFRTTPLRPSAYILSNIASYYVMTLAGVFLLVIVGRAVYAMKFGGNVLSVWLGFTLGALGFFALGYLIAGAASTARIAQAVGMIAAFPMMFLSGAAIPLEVLPQSVRNFSQFIPLTHVVTLMRGLWFGASWAKHLTEAAVLGGVLLVGMFLAARTFRWE
ncbi:MAG: ABC transporter permease [Acidobacteriota bacterium]